MAESVVVPLTAGQALVFQQLAQQEQDAQRTLSAVAAARNAAAMVVALAQHSVADVQGAELHIGAESITFTPNEPAPSAPALVE